MDATTHRRPATSRPPLLEGDHRETEGVARDRKTGAGRQRGVMAPRFGAPAVPFQRESSHAFGTASHGALTILHGVKALMRRSVTRHGRWTEAGQVLDFAHTQSQGAVEISRHQTGRRYHQIRSAHCVAMSARIAAISDFTSAAQSALSRTAVDAAPCDNANSWLTIVLIRSTCVRIWFLAVWRISGVDALPVATSAESPMTARGTFNS